MTISLGRDLHFIDPVPLEAFGFPLRCPEPEHTNYTRIRQKSSVLRSRHIVIINDRSPRETPIYEYADRI